MKNSRLLALCLSLVCAFTFTAATFTFGASAEDEVEDLVIPYTKIQQGIVDHINDRGFLSKVEDPEKGEVFKIAPNPKAEKSAVLTIDGYDAKKLNIDVKKYKYLVVDYYLHTTASMNVFPIVKICRGKEFTKTMDFKSINQLTKDTWDTAVFSIKTARDALIDPDVSLVSQFHFQPFAPLTISAQNANDYILIGNWTFTNTNPLGDLEYTVSFRGGSANAVGTAPESFKAKVDEVITLPKIEFTCEGKTAAGWLPSTGTKIYGEGDSFKMPMSNVTFSVNWKDDFIPEDLIALNLSAYINGICDNKKTATLEKNLDYEGRKVVKAVPLTESVDNDKAINLDGWTYGGARMNVNFHNTLIIVYKYVSKKPVGGKANLNIMKQDTFTATVNNTSMEEIVPNRWATFTFSMEKAKAKAATGVDPLLKQMHFYPFNGNLPKNMDPDDRLYVYKMIAVPDVATGSAYHESFIKGYADGTFGVSGNMTRAEACTIVSRLVAGSDELVPTDLSSSFTDVNESDWFYKYIAYCEDLGYLKSYSGAFLPNQNITRAEFVELVYNMGLLSDNGKNGAFTDVPADHPRFKVIEAAGKAGLVNGYEDGSFRPDNTITRAEVVKVINNAYGKKCSADGAFPTAKKLFSDVDESHWAYADILDAAVGHVSVIDEEGKEVWVYGLEEQVVEDTFEPDYEAGEKFLKETEAKIDARREEILNSKSDYKEATGKIWYVSNKGSDENDGASDKTPVATIARAHELANAGDAILFERGGMWRGSWGSKEGIIYSAYGEGPKPIMNGNVEGNGAGESNWTLVEGTTNIYKFKKNMLDVGNIIYNDGEKTVEKVSPKVSGSQLFVDGEIFDPKTSLKKNDTFISAYNNVQNGLVYLTSDKATLYVRCDEGNPGELYKSIEFATHNHAIIGSASNVIFDNLSIKYAGAHGIGSIGGSHNVTVRNCEVAYIGGTAQNYNKGNIIRYGNGVEVYGSCDGYYIDNCYVHQCYDAGVTHQISISSGACLEKDVAYTNNLIEKCIYNIEYFLGKPDNDSARLMQNILIKDNLLAKSGTGWGMNPSRSASIKGWDHYNRAEDFVIEGNTFFMDFRNACDLSCDMASWMPKLKNNTYCQYYGHTFTRIGASGATQYNLSGTTIETLAKLIGEQGAKVYYVKPGTPIK